jgi:hypothetical protein
MKLLSSTSGCPIITCCSGRYPSDVRSHLLLLLVRSRPCRRQLDYDQFRTVAVRRQGFANRMLDNIQLTSMRWPKCMTTNCFRRLLDQRFLCRQFVRRPRPSDPWFYANDCRAAKKLTRRLERAYLAASRRADAVVAAVDVIDQSCGSPANVAVANAAAAKVAWYAQRHIYRQLRQRKSSWF